MEEPAARSALAYLFLKLLQDLDSPRLPKSKKKRKGYRKACVSSSFFLAPSVKSRLRPAGFLQAEHVSLGEALVLCSIAQFRRKAILSVACLLRQRDLCVRIPTQCKVRGCERWGGRHKDPLGMQCLKTCYMHWLIFFS